MKRIIKIMTWFFFNILIIKAESKKRKQHLFALKYTSQITTLKGVMKGDTGRTFNWRD